MTASLWAAPSRCTLDTIFCFPHRAGSSRMCRKRTWSPAPAITRFSQRPNQSPGTTLRDAPEGRARGSRVAGAVFCALRRFTAPSARLRIIVGLPRPSETGGAAGLARNRSSIYRLHIIEVVPDKTRISGLLGRLDVVFSPLPMTRTVALEAAFYAPQKFHAGEVPGLFLSSAKPPLSHILI